MSKRVLDVGNCGPDHAAIRRMIQDHFDAVVVQAHQARDAFALLRGEPFHLVLVNRKLDVDYSEGMEIIRQLKADQQFGEVPVMLVSNHVDPQRQAVAAGAEPGFGKLTLGDPSTIERFRAVLE